MTAPGPARVSAVLVVAEPVPGIGSGRGPTSIDRRPVDGVVAVGKLGLAGDRVFDTRHHGGLDKALYSYADEDADQWAAELGRAVTPGMFGENLRTVGVDITGALIGEVWQVGEGADAVLLEVSMPRTPCGTFARWMGEPHWVRRFTRRGLPGAYLRVRRAGAIRAGDLVTVCSRPAHGVSVGGWFAGPSPTAARALLAAQEAGELVIAQALSEYLDRTLARAAR